MSESLEQKNQNIASKILNQAWNHTDFGNLDQLIADDAEFHFRGQSYPTNAQDLARIITGWHQSFSEFHFTIKEMLAEGDLVAVRLIMSGTHQSQWKDIPATGKQIKVTAMFFLRFEAGQLVEIWEDFDEYGLRKQLL